MINWILVGAADSWFKTLRENLEKELADKENGASKVSTPQKTA